jgi:hypothetical protein
LLYFLFYFLYLKILRIYFAMHYEIFWLWVLYDYTYFAIHYGIFWLRGFVWLLVVKCQGIILLYTFVSQCSIWK